MSTIDEIYQYLGASKLVGIPVDLMPTAITSSVDQIRTQPITVALHEVPFKIKQNFYSLLVGVRGGKIGNRHCI